MGYYNAAYCSCYLTQKLITVKLTRWIQGKLFWPKACAITTAVALKEWENWLVQTPWEDHDENNNSVRNVYHTDGYFQMGCPSLRHFVGKSPHTQKAHLAFYIKFWVTFLKRTPYWEGQMWYNIVSILFREPGSYTTHLAKKKKISTTGNVDCMKSWRPLDAAFRDLYQRSCYNYCIVIKRRRLKNNQSKIYEPSHPNETSQLHSCQQKRPATNLVC